MILNSFKAEPEFRELPVSIEPERPNAPKYRKTIVPHLVAGAAIVVQLVGPVSANVWSPRGGPLVSSRGHQFKCAVSEEVVSPNAQLGAAACDGGAVETLEYISTNSGLAISDIARAVGVTRQAIYGWQKGGNISPDNIEKLLALRGVIAKLLENDLAANRSTLRRKIGGKSVLDSLAAGEEVELVSSQLLKALLSERKQLQATRADPRMPSDEVEAAKISDTIGRQTRSI